MGTGKTTANVQTTCWSRRRRGTRGVSRRTDRDGTNDPESRPALSRHEAHAPRKRGKAATHHRFVHLYLAGSVACPEGEATESCEFGGPGGEVRALCPTFRTHTQTRGVRVRDACRATGGASSFPFARLPLWMRSDDDDDDLTSGQGGQAPGANMGQAVKWNRKGVIVCAVAIATGAVFLVCVRSHSVPREPRGHGETWDLSRYELPDMDPRFPVNCSAVVRGDEESIAEAMLLSITVEFKKRRPLAEDDYLRITRNCDAFKRDRRYVTVPLSDEEAAFPIAYSVVAHHRVDMLERLLRAIYAPQNVYCIHVDEKSPPPYQEAVRALAACFPNVFLASRQERVVYTSWLRVQADLNCMRDLVAAPQPWKYFINLCGLDFPIKTNLEMVRALRALNGENSMESMHTPGGKVGRWQIRHEIVNDGLRSTGEKKSPPPIPTPIACPGCRALRRRTTSTTWRT
ncbi:unnamed protein product [Lampetra planeri]